VLKMADGFNMKIMSARRSVDGHEKIRIVAYVRYTGA
jgi:hypothetical protein